MNTQNALLQSLLSKITNLEEQLNSTPPRECLSYPQSENRQTLLLTEKEIMKMPKNVRKFFRVQGKLVHYRKRTKGRYNCSYELRYAKKPYNKHPISASGSTLEEATARFIEKLNNYIPQADNALDVPKNFDKFAMYWFENFHKRKVCELVYKQGLARYKNHVKSVFGNLQLKDITAVSIQKLLDTLSVYHRLEEDVFSMLNQIFSGAVKCGLIQLNPVGMVFHQNGEREHGKRIKKNEEIKLFNAYKNTPIQIVFAVMTYTGLRPNEYETAKINNDFIIARNSKRKNGKEEIKRIPITPMLRPYLEGIAELPKIGLKTLDRKFKEILPNHKLYDMRTTFQTRCSECGIPDNVIGVWMGNSIGKLKDAYTDFSDKYLLEEAEKFKY